jgi:hypothetical protein
MYRFHLLYTFLGITVLIPHRGRESIIAYFETYNEDSDTSNTSEAERDENASLIRGYSFEPAAYQAISDPRVDDTNKKGTHQFCVPFISWF